MTRVYTDKAVFLTGPDGVTVRETFGCTFEELQELVPVPLKAAARRRTPGPWRTLGLVTMTDAPAAARTAPQASDQYVQSLARGLAVIRAFDTDHPVMTLTEVAARTGLTRATARRFLHTLVELDYVRTDGKTFALTAKVLQLGYAYLSGLSLPQLAQPHLEELSLKLGESTSAAVLDGTDIAYIARVTTRRIMNVGITVGTRFPAYATSMGRVLLAALPPAHSRNTWPRRRSSR